jgi:Type I phosphodiesterase / nucleotide pyrophosphatase
MMMGSMRSTSSPRVLILFAVLAGVAGFAVGAAGSLVLGVFTGLVVLAIGLGLALWSGPKADTPPDPGRRRFIITAGAAGFAWAVAGSAIGWTTKKLVRPAARPVQEAMAHDLGAEYMELVRRAYMPGRSGDLQLLLAPFNSSNYSNESTSLVHLDPRTSHASVWMYLERVPLVVHAPGRLSASQSAERVTLADIAPTMASHMGMDWPGGRAGRVLPGAAAEGGARPPKVIVTFVFDGGGWNVLDHWSGHWPTLERLMHEGANYTNAIHGSFPAVTACAHATIGTGTYPNQHGITGHNIRDGRDVRKAYGELGRADPSDIKLPTLADLWSDQTSNRAWVGEIGYQIWHLGMLGFGGRSRPAGAKPVAVFWDETGTQTWQPQNPDLYRLPKSVPSMDVFAAHQAAFTPPTFDARFTPTGRAAPCCSPPVIQYQGDLIESTFDSEPLGQTGSTDLLYINFKSPDYTGHVYGMQSEWEPLVLAEVDAQLERLVKLLDERFPEDYVLIVTADHGQCPLPDSAGGVRLDPIQLQDHVNGAFAGIKGVVQSVVPSEIYLDTKALRDNGGATVEDVAAFLRDYRYHQNIGPYVARNAIEQQRLDQKEFAAVLATTFLDTLKDRDLSVYGETAYVDADPGVPSTPA